MRSASVPARTAAMNDIRLGDTVIYCTRSYVLRGVSPMSVDPPYCIVEDSETRERIAVTPDEIRPLPGRVEFLQLPVQ